MWVPDEKTEAERDLVRCYRTAIDTAKHADQRLHERYEHLAHERHKSPNKAKMAVVNELVRWIWVIGLQVRAKPRPGYASMSGLGQIR